MAKKSAHPSPSKVSKTLPLKATVAAAPVATVSAIPPSPPAVLNVTMMTWKKDAPIHRIHLDAYNGDQFNPGIAGNARFSPIKDASGIPIPTIYGGSSLECAAMETVFHDVSYVAGFKSFDKKKLNGQVYSVISSTSDLNLVDLSSKPLRKLGIERNQLIDTEKTTYPTTRLWAEAIHNQFPDVQGLHWVSRQDDQARAIVLFGDRVNPSSLVQKEAAQSLTEDIPTYEALLALAKEIGVDFV